MTRMHPLHNTTDIAKSIHATGEYFDQTRGTGRSTALALKFIAQAIEAPYKAIRIRDHNSSHGTIGNIQRDKTLLTMAAHLVGCMGLKQMYFNYPECTVTFGEARPTIQRMTATEVLEAKLRDAQYAYEKMYGRRL